MKVSDLKDDLIKLRNGLGFAALTDVRADFMSAIGGSEQPTHVIKAKFIHAIKAIHNQQYIKALMIAYGFEPGYEDILDLTSRRTVYRENEEPRLKDNTSILKRENNGIDLLARYMLSEAFIEAQTSDVFEQPQVDQIFTQNIVQGQEGNYCGNLSRLCSILLGFPLGEWMNGQTQRIADSVELFAKEKFTSPLFFDKDTPSPPTLKDVYTFQNFVTYGLHPPYSRGEYTDLETLICKFLEAESYYRSEYFRNIGCVTNEVSGLIILANAGMGKSSILSWIAYYCDHLFPASLYRHVYLAKLRDLSEHICSIDQLAAFFGEAREYVNGSIFLLDAFDEFTTSSDDGKRIAFIESLCYQIYSNGGRLIITSRLNYFEHLNPHRFTYALAIGLRPFTSEQAERWWINYHSKDSSSITHRNFGGIQRKIENTVDREFYGIPIVLYMIAYSGINVDEYKTKYDLYTALFGISGIRLYGAREVGSNMTSLNYNKKYVRFELEEATELFNVLCDIAYKIYQNEKEGYTNGRISRHQIHEIIQNNRLKKYEAFLMNHYSIASYFRGSTEGVLEFVHRSIFDYYLAQWILRDYRIYNNRKAFELMQHTPNETNRFLFQAIALEGMGDTALVGLDLSGADFTGIYIKANLKGTNLSKATVKGGSLVDSSIDETTITEGMTTS